MIFSIKKIKNNFSLQAQNYDDLAYIQKNAAQKLCDFSRNLLKNDIKLLDLGSGTSFIAKTILNLIKNPQIFETDLSLAMLKQWQINNDKLFKINCDIKNLPFNQKTQFDAIFSSFSLQWLENYDIIFADLYKLLKQDGFLAICLPTIKTLAEINISNRKSHCGFNINKLPDQNLIIKNLEKHGFKPVFKHNEIVKQRYCNAVDCIKQIKQIGANYSATKTMLNKTKLQIFNDFFAKDFDNVASWHICYLIYKK